MFNKCAVSLIRHCIPSFNCAHIDSKERERYSMTVLYPDVKRRMGLPDIYVLYNVAFLPGQAFSMYI